MPDTYDKRGVRLRSGSAEGFTLRAFNKSGLGWSFRAVPPDQAAAFGHALALDNLYVHQVVSGLLIPVMAALWLYRDRLFGTGPAFLFCLIGNAVFFPVFSAARRRSLEAGGSAPYRPRTLLLLQMLYDAGLLAYGLSVVFLSFPEYDATLAYFMTVFFIAGFVYQPPWAGALLFVSSGIAVALILFRYHPHSVSSSVHVMNAIIMLFFAWVFSIIVYWRKGRDFMNRRIIEQQNRLLSELAEQDRMTCLLNHESVLRKLDAEIDRARRIRYPLSIMLFDLDDFKKINDEYGHLSGDRVLKMLAEELRVSVRGTDVVGRYGGEEFLVVMPDTDSERAARFADRFRMFVAGTDFGEDIRLTVSGGIAEWRGQSATDLIRNADRSLYEAKRIGKNRIVTA